MPKKESKKEVALSSERAPRKDVYFVKLSEIKIEENFNVRQDMGDIKALAVSIEANGVRVPVRGYKKNGVYMLTDGHRRYEAVKLLADKGIEVRLPLICDGRESSAEQRVIDMLICNEGKKLNPVEESEAIGRLIKFGFTDSEIASKTGFTKVYISNLKLLQAAPKKIKDLIIDNVVSATLAMKILREEKDFDAAISVIETAIQFSFEGGAKKITDKNVRDSKGKTNSFSALKKVMKIAGKKDMIIRQDKIELFNFVQKLNDGDYTIEGLMNELYEPQPELELA